MEPREKMKEPIVVVGAGIIGLTTAYKLAKVGHTDVTVVEKFKYGGQFCSHANAGVIRGHKAWELKYASKKKHATILYAMFHSFINHLPFFNTLNEFDSNFTIDPRFFLSASSHHWGLLHFKGKLDRYLSSKFTKNPNGSQWGILKSEWREYCFKHANDILGKEKTDSLINKYIDKYNYAVGISHYNICTKDTSRDPKMFHVLKNVSKNIDVKNFDLNICDNVKQESFVPHDKNFLRLTWDNDKNSSIEVNPATIVANCGQFCKLLTLACQDLGVKFRFNTEVIKIIVDNNDKGNSDSTNRIKAIYTSEKELITCDKLVLSSGIMTNEMIKRRIFNSIEDLKPIASKCVPFIPIAPLEGFSITVKSNNYPYQSYSNGFFPADTYVSHFGDDCLRFTKFGYLRPFWYAKQKWQNWNDDSNGDLNETISDNHYVVSCVVENEMQYFEKKLAKSFIDGIEKYYLPLFNIDRNEWQNNRKLWMNWRPTTPDDDPIVSKVNEIDGLYINGKFNL